LRTPNDTTPGPRRARSTRRARGCHGYPLSTGDLVVPVVGERVRRARKLPVGLLAEQRERVGMARRQPVGDEQRQRRVPERPQAQLRRKLVRERLHGPVRLHDEQRCHRRDVRHGALGNHGPTVLGKLVDRDGVHVDVDPELRSEPERLRQRGAQLQTVRSRTEQRGGSTAVQGEWVDLNLTRAVLGGQPHHEFEAVHVVLSEREDEPVIRACRAQAAKTSPRTLERSVARPERVVLTRPAVDRHGQGVDERGERGPATVVQQGAVAGQARGHAERARLAQQLRERPIQQRLTAGNAELRVAERDRLAQACDEHVQR
jgi:hypothetical protein